MQLRQQLQRLVEVRVRPVIALSHVLDEAELMFTLGRYLEWLAPGQSESLLQELLAFLEHRNVVGWILLATMLFFSSLAFTVLENIGGTAADESHRRKIAEIVPDDVDAPASSPAALSPPGGRRRRSKAGPQRLSGGKRLQRRQ